jgi:hypothetical protein
VAISLGGSRKALSIARSDWALLSVAASERGLLPIQLQKTVYLLGQRYPGLVGGSFYEFRLVASGHFSEDVYVDAEALGGEGLVSIECSEDSGTRAYRATPAGIERARTLQRSLRPEVVDFLKTVVDWASTRTLEQLRRASIDPQQFGSPGPRPAGTLRSH